VSPRHRLDCPARFLTQNNKIKREIENFSFKKEKRMRYLEEKLHILNVLELDKFERNHRTVQLSRGQGNILQQKETNKQKFEQKI
jgi:hypothetical protein